jgi:hypothetical protein
VSHWLKTPHWSSDIPLDTPHPRLDALDERGFVRLRDLQPPIPESEYLALEYMDWKSGGDTNFAPIATADGELDCRGFWKPGDERPDKDGKFTINAERCPEIKRYVEAVGANFGRVRVIKLEPQDYDTARRQMHRDDNNRFNPPGQGWVVRSWLELTDYPDSFMILMEQNEDGLPDPDTEAHIPLHRGSQFLLDTQRLWHVVCHTGDAPRYALISSFESGPWFPVHDRRAGWTDRGQGASHGHVQEAEAVQRFRRQESAEERVARQGHDPRRQADERQSG